jgi:heat shock protein HslJ
MSVESFGDGRRGSRKPFARVGAALVAAVIALAVGSASGCVAGWRSAPPPPLPDFTTAQWHLAMLNHEPAVPAAAANRPWLEFNDKASRFEGSTGCNSISGPYDRNATYLRFGKMISTAMACSDAAVNQQEQAFKFALQNVDRYEIRGDSLFLSVGADAVALLVR